MLTEEIPLRGNTDKSGNQAIDLEEERTVTKEELMEVMKKKETKGLEEIERRFGSISGLLELLKTNEKEGLSGTPEDLEMRQLKFGRNFIPPRRSKWFIELAWEAFQDKILLVLVGAAIISIILGVTVDERPETGWVDGAAILCAVVLVVMVAAVNDWNKERQFRSLQKRLDDDQHFTVIRNGEIQTVLTADLVVGDIAQFKYGNSLPADGILLSGFDIKINEASLTGEAALVKKTVTDNPMILSGTQVMEGGGNMVVTAVGPNSQSGIIITLLASREQEEVGFISAAILWVYRHIKGLCCKEDKVDEELIDQTKNGENPSVSSGSVLQRKLNNLAALIGYFATTAAILTTIILIIRLLIEVYTHREPHEWQNTDWNDVVDAFIIGIIVLVVAIPEGLPLAVTISLAYSVKKMLTDNNLVRHLHACETMGNATTICSDKTGTLTTNRMTVVESYIAGDHYRTGLPEVSSLPKQLINLLCLNVAINSSYSSKIEEEDEKEEQERKIGIVSRVKNTALFWKKHEPLPQKDRSQENSAPIQLTRTGKQPKQVGNVTECALLMFTMSLGFDPEETRLQNPEEIFTKVYTFNSQRKYMATVIPLSSGGYRMFVKGASERILARCTSVHTSGDAIQPLTLQNISSIKNTVVSKMASSALRTIGLAYRDFTSEKDVAEVVPHDLKPDWEDEDNIINDLTLLAIVGIQDPVRPEVPGCIRQCQEAGITVRMVTGDNVETARAIATKCGILTPGDDYLVLEGEELAKKVSKKGQINQSKFDEVWPRLRVLARSSPTDKFDLVDHIIRSKVSKNREVVAVTGDGTNDGPALRKADVGFAMGIAGTDVAKEACDIILTDDNFASIVKAVKWGRNVYDSVSKFLQFQLTVNVVAVVLTVIAAASIRDSPLKALQLLWVNLIMDALASLALATERPTDDLLKRKPYGRKKPLISNHMWLYIVGHSTYQLIVCFVILYAGPALFDVDNGLDLEDLPSQHYTLIFNTFVLMQLFNEINARKVHGERNVFSGFFSNYVFLIVMAIQIVLQIIIAQFGNIVFNTSGLEAYQWFWCIFLGAGELIVHQLLLFIPIHRIPDYSCPKIRRRKPKEENDSFVEEDEDESDDEETSRARVMWIRNITRIRRQIQVVNAFRSSVIEARKVWNREYTQTPKAIASRHGNTGEARPNDSTTV